MRIFFKKLVLFVIFILYNFSLFANTSWFKKDSSWHNEPEWYSCETSWYSYEYHWIDGVIDLGSEKEFINQLSGFISSKVEISEKEKEERIKQLYQNAIKKFGIAASVIAVEIVVYAIAAPAAPAVSAIALCAFKGSVSYGAKSALVSAIASVIDSMSANDDFDELLAKSVDSAANGFLIGTIIGGITGGLSEYFDLKAISNGGLKLNDAARISKETGWPSSVIKQFNNATQYKICKETGLKYANINGRDMLIPNTIDLLFKDEFGRTNYQRMLNGLSALDKSGKPYELHHIGQQMKSPLAVLTQEQHRGKLNYSIWHETGKDFKSQINREVFSNERAEIWKAILQFFQK